MVVDRRLETLSEEPQSEPPPPAQVDDLDKRLITLLRGNGRTSNRELARLLGVSEVTIANRIRRLLSEDIIRIQAVPNPTRLGYPMEVIFFIHVDVQRLREVATALCDIPEVRFVSITSGAYDLHVVGLFRSHSHLLNFITTKLAPVPGIQKVESAHALEVLKRNPDWSPFGEVGSPTSPAARDR